MDGHLLKRMQSRTPLRYRDFGIVSLGKCSTDDPTIILTLLHYEIAQYVIRIPHKITDKCELVLFLNLSRVK